VEITAVLAGGLEKWIEFGILCGLLALSVGISISQQYFASTIRKALERIIEPKVHCLRDGKMQPVQAQELVPGDIIHLRQVSSCQLVPHTKLDCGFDEFQRTMQSQRIVESRRPTLR